MAKSQLNYNFGSLNKIQKSDTFSDYQINETSGVSTLKNLSDNSFTPDIFSGAQIFKAIVLRVEPQTSSGVIDWLASFFSDSDSEGGFVRVVARIPELHSMICDPFEYPLTDGTLDQRLVNQHPTFVGFTSDTKMEGSVGQIIQVSFDDLQNMTGPKFLGDVFGKNTISYTMKSKSVKRRFLRPGLPDLNAIEVTDVRVKSDLGERRSPTDPAVTKDHNGVDYDVSKGTAIHAMKGGILTHHDAGEGGAGKFIKIKHQNNTWSKYFHLSRDHGSNIHENHSQVRKGELIGYSGNTGASTGPHLHLELRGASSGGKVLDPKPFARTVFGH